ncbi:hypothetical protein AE925_11675 [Xanthomonas arboricola]|uniref:hypothetical protein n=1 Tax=Xanthomonas arboricola TaxID=56448 RepID=UPI00069DFB0A|nr:hypothetical protein [Xanthomonas arboricola]KOB18431.1 hypothetical protein AE925_11675 [Xanthomonas arboricola]
MDKNTLIGKLTKLIPGREKSGLNSMQPIKKVAPKLDAEPAGDPAESAELGAPPILTARTTKAGKAPKAPKEPRAPKAPRERTSTPAKPDFQVLTSPANLVNTTHRKLLLTGHSVFATMDSRKETPENFIAQPPRATVPALRQLLGRPAGSLRVFVDERLPQRPRTRYAIALDGYLKWGFKNGVGSTVLLGGGQDVDATYLEVYVFQDRVLVEMDERELPTEGDPHFRVTLDTLLDELRGRYPHLRLFAAAPLPDWGRADIGYLADKPIRGLSFVPLSATATARKTARPLIVLSALGALAYVGLVGTGWQMYASAAKRYAEEAADPELTRAGGINNTQLEVMQQRRMFMESPRPQVELARRSRRIVAGLASIPGVRISELVFQGRDAAEAAAAATGLPADPAIQPGNGPAPDVFMKLVVPMQGTTAMEQAKALMKVASDRTGLTLRVIPGGLSDDEAASTRTMSIEGFAQ